MTLLTDKIQEALENETDLEIIHLANNICQRIGYDFGYDSQLNKLVVLTDAFSREDSVWRFLLDTNLTHVTIQDRCSVLDMYREHNVSIPLPEELYLEILNGE